MIVEPRPTNPPGRGRSALRVLVVALPALLLLGVAVVGVLGPTAPAPAPLPSGPAEVAGITAAPDAPASGPPDLAIAPFPGYPAAVANMRVRGVSDTLAAHAAGHGAHVVAIAAFLRAWPGPACPITVTGMAAVGCPLDAIIAEAGRPDPTSAFGGFGAHIHAVVPPAVEIPGDAIRDRRDPGDLVPVVVIGRFPTSEAGCTGDMDGCAEPFTIERVAWAHGQRLGAGRVIADGLVPAAGDPLAGDPLADDAVAATAKALGPITTPLRQVYVQAREITAIDAVAGAALAGRGADPGAPVWYLRGLDVPYDPLTDPSYGEREPRIRWAVVEAVTGRVLARGSLGEDPQSAL